MLQFIPIRGKLYQPKGSIITCMLSITANCNNIETYTIGAIFLFIYNLGYVSLLLDNNDIYHNIQLHI